MPEDTKSASGTATPVSHHHPHHTAKRLRHFFLPSGRKVHVASSPDDVEHMRPRLSTIEKDEFDLVIHGSPEHVDALRETHNHHEQTREELRAQHGDLFDEFERVIRELDTLSHELHAISEHAVQLDANFSKYGYSAHLRTFPHLEYHSGNVLRSFRES